MSYCNTCRKWNGAAAVPAGANTDHLCRCLTRAQLRILQAVPIDGPSGSDWVAVGQIIGAPSITPHAVWFNGLPPVGTTLYVKRSDGVATDQPNRKDGNG